MTTPAQQPAQTDDDAALCARFARVLSDPRTWRMLAEQLHDPDPVAHASAQALIAMQFDMHRHCSPWEIARRALRSGPALEQARAVCPTVPPLRAAVR